MHVCMYKSHLLHMYVLLPRRWRFNGTGQQHQIFTLGFNTRNMSVLGSLTSPV